MKTKKFLLFLGTIFLFLMIFESCSSSKEVVQQKQETKSDYTIWKQLYFKDISLNDEILFYNSSKITLNGSFFNQTFFIENGALNITDSINNVSNIVEKFTPGRLVEIKKTGGKINVMYVSFAQNETKYNFSFYRMADETFSLNGKAEIEYKNKKYPVTASVEGSCLLLLILNIEKVENEIKDVAPGWQLGNKN